MYGYMYIEVLKSLFVTRGCALSLNMIYKLKNSKESKFSLRKLIFS